MAQPLKDSFGHDIPEGIAAAIRAVRPGFDTDGFLADALSGYDELELLARARHVAHALRRHLPADDAEALAVLVASLGPRSEQPEPKGMEPFFYAPHVFYVAEFCLDQWEAAMDAQYELTQRFSAEFSIRAFIDREPERTLARLRAWASDPSPLVRRLVSEGTRPRLPWAPRLRRFQHDPRPVLELLELLKDDPSPYVRRSVANNLNDIGKDHPDLLVETCRRWLRDAGPERRALVRHALRSAIKRGERGALEVLGFDADRPARILLARIHPTRPRIGGSVRIELDVENPGVTAGTFNVDLRIEFVKARGTTSPRTFKLGVVELQPAGRAHLAKTISLRQHTTRTHHPGEHRVVALVNGQLHPIGSFDLE